MNFLTRHFSRDTLRELARLALPMVVSQGAFAAMIFTDRYFMSQISAVHIAAAMGGGVASFFSISFFVGLLSYANAMAAQYLGADEKHKCARVVSQGFILCLLSVPFLTLITWAVSGIFARMDHPVEQVGLERTYYQILMLGALITMARVCLSSYFAGIGRTRIVMICDVFGLLINVPLCYVLAFGKLGLPALGIVGAGWSTVIASSLSLLMFAVFYLHRSHRLEFEVASSWVLDRRILRRFWRLGFPSGLELFLNVAAFNLFLLMFQSYGVTEGAAAAIVFNWDILSFIPMIGLNVGVISLVGRYAGARNMARVNEVITSAFAIALSYAGTLGIIYITFRYPLVEIFAPPSGDFSAIRELTAFMMLGLASYLLMDAVILVASGVLRGAGDTRWLMFYSVALHWVMLVSQYLIIEVYELGPRFSWLAFCLFVVAIALVMLGRLWRGKWRSPEALERVMAED